MGSLTRRRLAAQWLCLAVVLVATVARTIGPLNPHALALWSLDYRFGFVRRGLAGSMLSFARRATGGGDVLTLATPISFATFVLWGAALLRVTGIIARRHLWSPSVTLLSCAMLSSSYVVMHGYLVGYPDIATVVLGVAAIGLVVGEAVPPTRWFFAGALLSVATLLHEHALVLIYPTLWLVWFTHTRVERTHVARCAGLAMPVLAGLLLLASEQVLDRSAFRAAFDARLASQTATQSAEARDIAGFMATSVPEFLREQLTLFPRRLVSTFAVWHVWPQIGLTLLFLLRAGAVHTPALAVVLLIVTLAPWSLHAVAWDTDMRSCRRGWRCGPAACASRSGSPARR